MGYSKEVLTQARQALERQRADRESENAARQEQAYARLPRLREIDVALRSTMAKAALAAFIQGGDAQAALEQAKQENLALQAERKQLIETCFGGEDLEGKPLCDRCGGTGYVGSAMCQCLKTLCVQFQRQALGGFFPNARGTGKGGGIAGDDGQRQIAQGHAAQDGKRHFGANAADGKQPGEHIFFVPGSKTE